MSEYPDRTICIAADAERAYAVRQSAAAVECRLAAEL
jgi:hypothetical protein